MTPLISSLQQLMVSFCSVYLSPFFVAIPQKTGHLYLLGFNYFGAIVMRGSLIIEQVQWWGFSSQTWVCVFGTAYRLKGMRNQLGHFSGVFLH